MRRAYEQAGFGIDTVELIEAHGTGTVLGDRTEAESITHALREAGAPPKGCAVGTVKSMIGHTKGCAGIAGLIKVALALHHKVLPPTLWVKKPAAAELWAGDSPAYLNAEIRPWVGRDHPRRAGVSSFGFGGTNFHAVLEEHRPKRPELPRFPTADLPAELFCFRGPTVERLQEDIEEIRRTTEKTAALRDLAHRAFLRGQGRQHEGPAFSLSIVADSVDDLRRKLSRAQSAIAEGSGPLLDPTGIYFDPAGLGRKGKVAFVFPGQGSQKVDMLKDLTLLFGELRESFGLADRVLASRLPLPLSHFVYPPASFTEEEQAASMEALTRTDITQPALGAAGFGLYKVLRAFGIQPDMAAGHSVGEYVALGAAGVLEEETLYELLWTRGACMLRAAGEDTGTMMAIRGARETVEELVRDEKEIYIANFNAPLQTVVSGRRESLVALQAKLAAREMEARQLPVGCGFHSPFVEKAAKEFDKALASVGCAPATWPVYSNYLAATFPKGDADVREVLSAHLSHPVRFMEEIQRMYEDGARVFLEVGPGRVCGNLIGEILSGKPHVAVSCDGAASRLGTVRLFHALGKLFAHGVEVRLDPLFNRRMMTSSDVAEIPGIAAAPPRPKASWMVSPEMSWPVGSPRPQFKALPAVSNPFASPGTTPPRSTGAFPTGSGGVSERTLVPASTAARPPATPPPSPVATTPAATVPSALLTGGNDGHLNGSLAEVILRHQQLMAAFLQQQNQVMLTYLETRQVSGRVASITGLHQGAALVSTPLAAAPIAAQLTAPSPPAATPVQPVAPAADPVRSAPTAAVASALGSEELLQQLVALVTERTGYPAEMLTAEQDMEADLGIDSIKRVEILTSFARQFPNLGPEVPEQLRAARTLQDVVQVMRENVNGAALTTPDLPAASVTNQTVPGPAPGGEELLQQLVALVTERTGYPAEMLTAEQDMEADLGIDSIKRVEILTSFARQFPNLGPEVPEQLRAARTLQDVVQVMRENVAGGAVTVSAANPVPASERAEAANGFLDRFVIGMRESVLADGAEIRIPDGALLITDDGRGSASGLRERLQSLGGRPVIVRLEGQEVAEDGIYVADLADPVQVDALLDRIRRDHGRIGGVVHLLPLRTVPPVQDLSAATFGRLVDQEVKGLFYLLRFASSDLKSTPGGWAYTCLSFGAAPTDGTLPVPDHPWRGALIGVIKTVAVEWPSVVAKSLALEGPPSDESVGRILAELAGPREEHEAYYRAGSRLVPEPRKVSLQAELASVDLGPEDVILLIGGARGITSEVACEIARHARPTLILAGRSAWPEAEPDVTAGARSDVDLRRILFTELKAQGKHPSPMEVDAAARRILREREMRAARSLMEAAGSRVLYYQADIRDEASTEELFRRIYETHGRIDGVVCGAGIIEDKLIEDKTPESFDRVFDTKAKSIFHLAQSLRPESLKFFVMFSSVAGWTGNRGQVDYVAGNEVLNRMALHLSARWNRRVVAIDWGPWDQGGMVTAEARRQFLERGVALVSPHAGRRFLLDEIRFGSSSDPIVAAMGRLGVEEPAAAQHPVPAAGAVS
jgi:acyl transferase domain-containing protein/NAD(P)-dependent dehydrogenase (short-subunit alcohol dehydrogenase family)